MLAGFSVPPKQSKVRQTHRRKLSLKTNIDGIARVSHVSKAKLINEMNHSLVSGNNDLFKQSLVSAITILSKEARVSDLQIKNLHRAISTLKFDQSKDDSKMLTTGAVAKKLGVSNQAVINWIETGKMKAFRSPGGHYRIPSEQFRTTEEQDATSEAIFEKLWAKRASLPPINEDDLGDL